MVLALITHSRMCGMGMGAGWRAGSVQEQGKTCVVGVVHRWLESCLLLARLLGLARGGLAHLHRADHGRSRNARGVGTWCVHGTCTTPQSRLHRAVSGGLAASGRSVPRGNVRNRRLCVAGMSVQLRPAQGRLYMRSCQW